MMRALLLGISGLLIIVAAVVTLGGSVHPFHLPAFVASLVLTLAAGIQRLRTVQRFFRTADRNRESGIQNTAQQTLNRLVRNRRVRDDTFTLVVHVWEVPPWYRKLFPFSIRKRLRKWVVRPRLARLSRLAIRPSLRRSAAACLRKPTPSNVTFTKGRGLVGICLAANDSTNFLELDTTTPEYQAALDLSETEWDALGVNINHGIKREDARLLARRYGQVLAKVVQDQDTGEAIGCVTISVAANDIPELQIFQKRYFRRELTALTETIAPLLVKL